MLVTNDLTKNAKRIADDVWIVKSKKKEDALKASTQVFPGGSTVVVARPGANYVKITDGSKTFSELKTVGEGEDGPGGGVQSVTGDGVGGTASNPVLSFPTPAEISAATSAQGIKADSALQASDTSMMPSAGKVPIFSPQGLLSTGTPEFPENAVPLAYLDDKLTSKVSSVQESGAGTTYSNILSFPVSAPPTTKLDGTIYLIHED